MDEAIMGILAGITITLGLTAVIGYYFFLEYKKKKLMSDQILAAIEKGGEVPALDLQMPKTNYMRRGLVFLFFGIALFIALWVQVDIQTGVWGLLFIGLGAAYILVEKYEKDKS